MKKTIRRLLGAALAACMVMTSTTAFAAHQAQRIPESISLSARASEKVNLALGKTATANEVESGTKFTANLAVDGDKATRWASNPKKNVPGDKWLQIDFGEETTFDTVDISWEQLNIIQYRVEISSDLTSPENWTTVYESTSRITTKDESILLPKDAKGRYLRITVTDCDGAESGWDSVSIYELAVYYMGGGSEPEEPTGNYRIYPTPQQVTDSDKTIELSGAVNVIKEDSIDTVTQNRVDEVLSDHGLTAEYSDTAVSGKTNLYIGVNGSGGAADLCQGVPREVFTEGENKFDMHVVQIKESGDIVILGKDTDAAFYGLATLEQILDQAENNMLKVSTFEDYANQKYRGAVEGYYGFPWTVDGTKSWMDYAKRYKMNIFLYGPKSDPYHLGKWKEDYPTQLTEEEKAHGVLSQDDLRDITAKAAQCNVDFVWVAHPAMQNGINFSSNETIDQGVQDLMKKFDHMYDLGVREFGVFLDDIPYGSANGTKHAYLIDQVQKKLYETYNVEGTAAQDMVKPLFFTPTYYTTSGAASYLSAFRNIHEDIVVCFTGNDVFSDIRNADAAQYESWLGRSPCLWWNYPVNDNDDNVFYTCPIDSYYAQDADISNLVGIVSNPMNFEEASKVAFFGVADYAWNPGAFDAQQNWNHSFASIFPDDPEMAEALKVVYSSLNKKFEPMDLRKLYNQYKSEAGTGVTDAAESLRDEMTKIIDAIQKIESLKNSDDPAQRLLLEEAQTSINKLYDMAVVIKGVMNATLSGDALTVYQGYFSATAAFDRLNIVENPRYEMTSLEGAGEEITVNKLGAVPSDTYMRPFTQYLMDVLKAVELPELDPSLAGVRSVTITAGDAEVKQGETGQYYAAVTADRTDAVEVIWTVEDNTDSTTTITPNGLLTMGKNELSQEVTVRATSAYDPAKSAAAKVTVMDRVYTDPTIPTNVAHTATVIGFTGEPTGVEVPERALDENDETKWCPGANTSRNQWMAIDLGSKKTINQWMVLHAGAEGAAYITKDFSLQVLKDENPTPEQLKDMDYLGDDSNWTTVKEIKNNNSNYTDISFEDMPEGRYFRLYVANGGSGGYPATRIYEWKLMGVDTDIVAHTYRLSVDSNITNGSVAIESPNYQAGVRVNIQVVPEDGYRLKEGTLRYNGTEITGNRFIMPEEDVVITAEFEPDSAVETYRITVDGMVNGTVTADKQSAAPGENVTVTVTPDEGYRLVEGSLKGNGTPIENNRFVMPEEDVVITAEFERIPAATYQITIGNTVNGRITADKQSAAAGETVTVTATPDKGYRLVEGTLKANDTVVENSRFVMPAGDVVITAEFEKVPAGVVTDVLQAIIEKAEQLKANGALENTMVAVVEEFNAALEAGKELADNPADATQTDINEATLRILNAMAKVDWKQGDKTALGIALDIAKELEKNIDLYIEPGRQAFLDALAKASGLFASGNAWDDEIKAATSQLVEAMANLRMAVNKDALHEMIEQARNLDLSPYTEESAVALRAALLQAEKLLTKENAAQYDVDQAAASLQAALNSLQYRNHTGDTPVPEPERAGSATKTGDNGGSAAMLTLLGAAGLIWMLQGRRKRS